MKTIPTLFAACVTCALVANASAQVVVKDAWVRATVPQQKATGAFMQLTAAQNSKLIAVSSSAVPVVEVHEMSMEGGVMKMRPVSALALPAGKTVALTPGGYHVMLMDLKQQMKAGEVVPLSLTIANAAGKRETIEVKAEVRAPGTQAIKPDNHMH